MRESKSDRFRRVAEAKVNKLIKILKIELDKARQRYCSERIWKRLSLSETQSPISDTMSYPHITLTLPNGQRLRAVAYAKEDYPAINMYLLKGDLREELICFAEFNQERAPGHEICIGTYQSVNDEPKYYASYEEERDQYDKSF